MQDKGGKKDAWLPRSTDFLPSLPLSGLMAASRWGCEAAPGWPLSEAVLSFTAILFSEVTRSAVCVCVGGGRRVGGVVEVFVAIIIDQTNYSCEIISFCYAKLRR